MKPSIIVAVLIIVLVVLAGAVWWTSPETRFMTGGNRVGVMEIKGAIEDAQELLKGLKEFREDKAMKAIVLRIDSPGGVVGPSQELYREIRRTVAVKPVVASLGSMAASGGYYVASAADWILSNPGTITGSIGVIIFFPKLQELFEKIGYGTVVIKSGQFKDVGNPGREMTPEEKQLLQSMLDESHGQFIRDVAAGRKLPEEKVRAIADGRVFTGEAAQKLGLVDELGNFQDAVTAAGRLGRIEGEPELIKFKKKKRSMLDLALGTDVSERVEALLGGSGCFLRYQMLLNP